jgi:diaminopimelate epimerase
MNIPFTKMHGLGNDFIVIDGVSRDISISPERIRELAHRRFGIGFDQLLLVEPPSQDDVDFNYRIFNVDGGEVEHCGNGARCFARFVRDKGLTDKNPVRVKTSNRILVLDMDEQGNVAVDMGLPVFVPAKIPLLAKEQALNYRRTLQVAGESIDVEFSALSMGNPHAVIKVEDLDKTAVKDIGEALGKHPDFPEGVNVGFMEIVDRQHLKLRVFERGTGETLACGTGACAAVVSARRAGLLDNEAEVQLRGGSLSIHWDGDDQPVMMTGPTASVFEGTVEI